MCYLTKIRWPKIKLRHIKEIFMMSPNLDEDIGNTDTAFYKVPNLKNESCFEWNTKLWKLTKSSRSLFQGIKLALTSHVQFCLRVVQIFRHRSIKYSLINSDIEFDQITFSLIIMELSTSLILANCCYWHYLLLCKCIISHLEWAFLLTA